MRPSGSVEPSPAPILYLHGYASGPLSSKVTETDEFCLAHDIPLLVPDLNLPSPSSLGLDAMAACVRRVLRDARRPMCVVANSLGAAAFLRAMTDVGLRPKVAGVVLVAPVWDVAASISRVIDQVRRGQRGVEPPALLEAATSLLAETSPTLSDQFADWRLPLTIVSGERDEIVPVEEIDSLARRVPQARRITFDTDHTFQESWKDVWGAVLEGLDYRYREVPRFRYELVDSQIVAPGSGSDWGAALDLLEHEYARDAYPRGVHRERIEDENALVVAAVGTDSGRPVGFAYVRPDGKIGAVAVSGECRGQGIGTRLLRVCARIRGRAFFEVDSTNTVMPEVALGAGYRSVSDRDELNEVLTYAGHRLETVRRTAEGDLVYVRDRLVSGQPRQMRLYTIGWRTGFFVS